MYTDETQFELTMVVEPVDNWHPRWEEVLDAIDQSVERESLGIDAEGWLPARQVLLIAFIEHEIAGHIAFRVQPADGRDVNGRPVVEARFESHSVEWRFSGRPVERALFFAAKRRARLIGCSRLVGFDEVNWSNGGCCLEARCA